MRKLFLVALPVGIAVAIATSLVSSGRERAAAAEARIERARLKRDFSERSGLARGLAPDRLAEWRDEVQALSRWYFDELTAIRNRHPGEPARPSAVDAARGEKKKPSEKELATETRSRIVFPLVGSTPGGAGAFWISDLTLHNPLREPMPLALRYVSGDVRLDRRIGSLFNERLRSTSGRSDAIAVISSFPGGG